MKKESHRLLHFHNIPYILALANSLMSNMRSPLSQKNVRHDLEEKVEKEKAPRPLSRLYAPL